MIWNFLWFFYFSYLFLFAVNMNYSRISIIRPSYPNFLLSKLFKKKTNNKEPYKDKRKANMVFVCYSAHMMNYSSSCIFILRIDVIATMIFLLH